MLTAWSPRQADAATSPPVGAQLRVAAVGADNAQRVTATISNPRRSAVTVRVAVRAGAARSAARVVCPAVRRVLKPRSSATVACTWQPPASASGAWRVELLVATGTSTKFSVRATRAVTLVTSDAGSDDGESDDEGGDDAGEGGDDTGGSTPATDTTAPAVVIRALPARPTAPFVVEVDARDASEVVWVSMAVDGGQPVVDRGTPFSFPIDPARLPAGEHTIAVVAADVFGNTATATASFTTEPSGGGGGTGGGGDDSGSGTGGGDDSGSGTGGGDGSGSGTGGGDGSGSGTGGGDGSGSGTGGGDGSGTGSGGGDPTPPVDTTPPSLTVSGVPTTPTRAAFTATADAADTVGVTSVTFRVDSAPVVTRTTAPYALAIDPTTLGNGSHVLTVTATDAAGNATTRIHEFAVDTAGPTLTVNGVPTTPTRAAFTAAADATDTAGVTNVSFRVDSAATVTRTTAPYRLAVDPATLSDGAHVLAVTATDAVGNTTTRRVDFTTDTTAPALNVGGVPTSPTRATFTATADATDATGVTGVSFRVDSAAGVNRTAAPYRLAVDPTTLSDGTHTLTVTATDGAGNTATRTNSFAVDTSGPALEVSGIPTSVTNASFTASATSSDASGVANVSFQIDGAAPAVVSSPPWARTVNPASLADGSHTLTVVATDSAGNATTRRTSFATDVTAPTASITAGPGAGSFNTAETVSLTFSSEAGASFSCRLDAAAWAPCTSPARPDRGVGAHTFEVRATDAAGNVSAPVSRSWTDLPGAHNTGVPAGTQLRVVRGSQAVPGTNLVTASNGDLTITTPGVTIDGIDLYGRIRVQAANVTIRNSFVRGPSNGGTGNSAVIDANHASVRNLLVEDSTLVPQTPSYWLNGMIGHDYTARRVHTYNVVDGFGVYNNTGDKVYANVAIESSYVHDLSWYVQDMDHTDGTHNDAIQVQGGGNIRIVGNNLQGYNSTTVGTPTDPTFKLRKNQGILIQWNVSPVFDVVVDGNYLDGSAASVYLITPPNGQRAAYTVRNNRFGRDQLDYGNGSRYQMRIQSRAMIDVDGLYTNVWHDTGAALAEGRNTGIRYDG